MVRSKGDVYATVVQPRATACFDGDVLIAETVLFKEDEVKKRLFARTVPVLVLVAAQLLYAGIALSKPSKYHRGEIVRVASQVNVDEARETAMEKLASLSNSPTGTSLGVTSSAILKEATFGAPFLYYWAGEAFADYENADPSTLLEFMRGFTVRFPIILDGTALGTINVATDHETGGFKVVSTSLGPDTYNRVASVRKQYPKSEGWDVYVLNTGLVGTYIVLQDASGRRQLIPTHRSGAYVLGLDPDGDYASERVSLDSASKRLKSQLMRIRQQKERSVEKRK